MKIMGKILACRACLATDVKLYCMCKFSLKKAFENVTDTKVVKGQNYPQYLCSYCAALVLKFEAFKGKCEQAKDLLNITIMQYNSITTNHIRNLDRVSNNLDLPLTIHKVDMQTRMEIKDEFTVLHDEILTGRNDLGDFSEDIKDICSFASDFDPVLLDNDDSDDEPLNRKVKKETPNEAINDEDTNNASQDDEQLKNIEIVILTKEEQIEEVQARKNSFNYQNNQYKCNLCYRGFITEGTFKNHMFRHDTASGTHLCEICQTRCPTVRSLRSHVAIAHERKFLCQLCNYVSRSKNKAKEHVQWHAGYLFRCKACQATFSKSTSYLSHVRLQHPSKHCCDQCGESFIGENGLKLHKKKAHRVQQKWKKEHKCKLCDVQFHNMDALKMHSSMSDPTSGCDKSLRPCLECGHSFLNDESVRDHIRTHRKNVYVCHDCNRTFTEKRSLAVHYQRVHLGLKYIRSTVKKDVATVCEVCGYMCQSKASLVNHQRIHTGEKPFQCPECPNSFRVQQRLQVHMRTHTGERPYKCSMCPKAFKNKPAINRHIRVHTGAKPYECTHCGKCFSQSNSLKGHINSVHMKLPSPYKHVRKPKHILKPEAQ